MNVPGSGGINIGSASGQHRASEGRRQAGVASGVLRLGGLTGRV